MLIRRRPFLRNEKTALILPFAVALVFSLLLVFSLGCDESQVDTPQRNFERPVDMAFFCAGPVHSDSDLLSALGKDLCDTSLMWCEGTDEECEDILSERTLLALVLNSVRGELGLINITSESLLDVWRDQPGFNFVPVGSNPTAVGVSFDGCAAVTLNAGSCDFSVVDTTRLLGRVSADTTGGLANTSIVNQISFLTDSGTLAARPSELVMVPSGTWPPPVTACEDLVGYRAYVSFPSCALVAEVNLESGRILQSMRVTAQGLEDAGTDPVCPRQCPDMTGDAVDGGELSDDRPGHLAYSSFAETGGSPTLYIASDQGSYVAVIDITPEGAFNFGTQRVIELEATQTGIRKIRLSPMTLPPNDWQFLYVVTRDGDIRVVDVSSDPEVECETNPDPRDPLFETTNWRQNYRYCIPLKEGVQREALKETPGIELPSKRRVVDVAFTTVDATGYDDDLEELDPLRLDGMFAYAISLDGATYMINVDEIFDSADGNGNGMSDQLEARLEDGIHAVISHQLRNLTDTRSTEDGPVQAEEPFTYYRQGSEVPDPPAGIILEQVTIEDSKMAVDELWSLIYEGVLPGGSRISGYVLQPNPAVDDPETAEFRDNGSSGFCTTGVKVGDRLILHGCEFDEDCPEGFSCMENPRDVQDNGGVCLDSRYADDETLRRACFSLAQGTREYEILEAYDDSLILGVTLAPGTPCEEASDCVVEGQPSLSFLCQEGQCVVDCSEVDGNGNPLEDCSSVEGICVEGRCIHAPLPDKRVDLSGEVTWCLPSLVSYELRASGEYLVTGSSTGYFVARKADTDLNGLCVEDLDSSPLIRFRMEPGPETFSNPILSLVLGGTSTSHLLERDDSILFEIVSGFNAIGFDVACRLPSVAITAVDGNIYIVDMGDDVQTTGGVAGQIVRILPPEISLDTGFLIQ